jgi:hypothetical protein
LEAWLKERNTMADILQQHFLRAQHRMKTQADKKRSERHLEVDDLVYLKLQPYIQSSVATRSNHKLSFKFFGPYRVVQRIGPVAYKLELPSSSRIHPVVHVSQLKQALGEKDMVSTDLPIHCVTDESSVYTGAVLEERFIRRGRKMVPQIKIQWTGLPLSCATWEHLYAVVEAFQEATAWGQVVTEGKGIVTTMSLPDAVKVVRRASRRQEIKASHLARLNKAQDLGRKAGEDKPTRDK